MAFVHRARPTPLGPVGDGGDIRLGSSLGDEWIHPLGMNGLRARTGAQSLATSHVPSAALRQALNTISLALT